VIYPQYFWYQLYPSSGDSTNPTLISPGSSITVNLKLVYYDATADLKLPSPTYWIVKVTITRKSDGAVVKTINFGRYDDVQGGVKVDDHYCSIAIWEESWTVPAGADVTYKFDWSVQIKDSSGNDYGTKTKTTYAKTAGIEPDGVFKINGKDASQTSKLVVLGPTLTLEFVPSKNAEKITAVKVEVWKGDSKIKTVTLDKQDGNYKKTYKLPEYGVYRLDGYIEWTGGDPIQKMSIVSVWGEEKPPKVNMKMVFPTISVLVGIALLVLGQTGRRTR
jgi:hypothetical protein